METEAMRRWNELMAQINSDILIGPFITNNGLQGNFSPTLIHTGLTLEVSIPDHKIQAPILRNRYGWRWGFGNFVILLNHVEFSFASSYHGENVVDGHLVIGFFEVLRSILTYRRTGNIEIMDLLRDLEPIMEGREGAPLKRNALTTLIPYYSEMGFATAPPKLQKTSIALRIVWIYPKFRRVKAIENYLPVGTVKFQLKQEELGAAQFSFPWYNRVTSEFSRLFLTKHEANPLAIFSDEGVRELNTVLLSRKNKGHERTKMMEKRMELVHSMKKDWRNPRKIAVRLRDEGLYSLKSPVAQQVSQVEALIQRIRRRESGSPSGPE